MNRFIVLTALLLPAYAISAQPTDKTEEAQKSYSDIFTDIMESLPQESRAQVDSASQARPRTHSDGVEDSRDEASTGGNKGQADELAGKRSKALDELPPDVRQRVEKAMETMKQRHENKAMQFKEKKGVGE